MRTVQTSAGAVAWTEAGSGSPVLLLHANLHDHRDFDPIVSALARDHRVIALDWPGHGASDPQPAVTAAMCAEVLVEVTEALALGPAVLIGSSVGGYAATRLALEHPERVAGLVLVDTAGFTGRSALTRAYCRFFASSLMARRLPQLVRWYTRPASEHDHRLVARVGEVGRTAPGRVAYRSMWRSFNDPGYDLTARAGAITTPTLLVWGRRDPVIPVRYGRKAQRLIPAAQLAVLDTGHLPFSSAPQKFLDVVGPFLRSVAPQDRSAALSPSPAPGPQ